MRKPLIIYISGSPGSGKSTLAEKIAKALYLPHISSDLIHAGVRLTTGKPNDRFKSFHESYIPLLIQMAKTDISFVVDQVMQRSLSEDDVIAKIEPYAKIINIHTKTGDPIRRHVDRELARVDKGVYMTADELRDRAQFHQDNLSKTDEPLDLNVPQLVVVTDDGYDPAFADVLEFIEHHYPRRGE